MYIIKNELRSEKIIYNGPSNNIGLTMEYSGVGIHLYTSEMATPFPKDENLPMTGDFVHARKSRLSQPKLSEEKSIGVSCLDF